MPSNQYYEGKSFEKSSNLFEATQQFFNFTSITAAGGTTTKSDLVGHIHNKSVHISVKYASGANTQVHLPTLRSLATQLELPDSVYHKLDKFLGTNDCTQWQAWQQDFTPNKTEKKYQRFISSSISGWDEVVTWFNANKRQVSKLLLQRLDSDNPVEYLIWAVKNKGSFQIIDVNKLIDYIDEHCEWVTMPKGTVIRCQRKADSRPIFFMQMKNSGGPPGGYNHTPQFHLCSNWPKDLVVYEKTNLHF